MLYAKALRDGMYENDFVKYRRNPPFTLSSGQQSPWYFDVKSALMHFDCAGHIAALLKLKLYEVCGGFTSGMRYQVIGPANGGYLLASMACSVAPVTGAVLRKDAKTHGLESALDGTLHDCPTEVIVVDDVLTTGKSILPILDLIDQRDNYKLCAVMPVIDRSDRDGMLFIPYTSDDGVEDDVMISIGAMQPLMTMKDFETELQYRFPDPYHGMADGFSDEVS